MEIKVWGFGAYYGSGGFWGTRVRLSPKGVKKTFSAVSSTGAGLAELDHMRRGASKAGMGRR